MKTNKIKMGEFVYMTQEEYANLIAGYGLEKVKDLVQRMNTYIGSVGDKYKSHYHTCISWFTQKGIKRINNHGDLEQQPEKKIEKPFIPLTDEQRIKAKEMLLSFRAKFNGNPK